MANRVRDRAVKLAEENRKNSRVDRSGFITTEGIREAWRSIAAESYPFNAEITREKLRRELLAYYRTPEGRNELASAPLWLREKPVEGVVDLLMEDTYGWDESGFMPTDPRGASYRTP